LPKVPTIAPNFRPMTGHASPSSTCWKNAPRWVRSAAGRSQSRKEISVMNAAVARPTSASRAAETRLPDSRNRKTARPGMNDSTPPKSAPHAGQPSAKTASPP